MSEMPEQSFCSRLGKWGLEPSSLVNTDSKYSLSKLALSQSRVINVFSLFLSGAIPDLSPILLFTNL